MLNHFSSVFITCCHHDFCGFKSRLRHHFLNIIGELGSWPNSLFLFEYCLPAPFSLSCGSFPYGLCRDEPQQIQGWLAIVNFRVMRSSSEGRHCAELFPGLVTPQWSENAQLGAISIQSITDSLILSNSKFNKLTQVKYISMFKIF